MAHTLPVNEDALWVSDLMRPIVEANERECNAIRVEIGRRGTDWAAEEIVDLRRKLATLYTKTAKRLR